MSLLRQLLLSVTIAIVAILIGTLVFSINGARDYLNQQLQAQSDNAATSLALTLSQPENQDDAIRELLISALYDSGQFAYIGLRDTGHKVIVERRVDSKNTQGSAPQWFSQMLPLEVPQSIREVSSGWSQVGTLIIISNDEDAKSSLWSSTTNIVMWVLLAGLLWLVFVRTLLSWLKRALHSEITRQVDSISKGQDNSPSIISNTIADLLPPKTVLTQARERVQASREEANAKIETLTLELNTDAVTGLPNRRYFMNELRKALQISSDSDLANDQNLASSGGFMLLCRQRDLVSVSKSMPREQVDAWLKKIGDRLKEIVKTSHDLNLHLARLNGSDFVVLIDQAQAPQAMALAQVVRTALQDMRVNIEDGKLCRWAAAMTDYIKGDSLSDVVSRLDTALMAAESSGEYGIEILLRDQIKEEKSTVFAGEEVWRDLINNAIDSSYLSLSTEIVNYGDKLFHNRNEATLTITDPSHNDGKPLSGFLFMPAAVRLGMSSSLDIRALELANEWIKNNAGELVVRVSVPSLIVDGFMDAATQVLKNTCNPGRIIVEVDAFGLVTYTNEVRQFITLVTAIGAKVGLRGLTRQLDAIALLQGLSLHYIRLGGGFMDHLENSQGAITLLQAIIDVASALDIFIQIDDELGEYGLNIVNNNGVLLRSDKTVA